MKRKALGKGLRALIPEAESPTGEAKFHELDIELIIPSDFQPRERFDREKLEKLARSIREEGVLQPILVRPHEEKYQLVAGERRLRAAREAGLKKIPAFVKEINDEQLLELALIENLQREDLNPVEEAEAYQKLMQKFDYTQEQIADKVGKDRTSITNYLRLLNLPEKVKNHLIEGKITAGHGKALLGLGDPFQQEHVCNFIIKKNLSVREAESMVSRRIARVETPPEAPEVDIFTIEAEKKLQRFLGCRVSIKKRKKGGKLEIHYATEEELQRIYEAILPREINEDI
jgi:ParB family chromosome partitioning protein